MNDLGNSFANFFGVAVRGQTYLNALYLLMSFPLGIFYFVFLVTGLALGFPLIIIWIGLLILAAVFAAWYGLLAFERHLAIRQLLRRSHPSGADGPHPTGRTLNLNHSSRIELT